MQELYDYVLERLEELKIPSELKPCVELYEKYSYSISSFVEYNFSDYLYIIYVASNPNEYEKYKTLIDKYKSNFDRIVEEDLNELSLFNRFIMNSIEKQEIDNLVIKSNIYNDQLTEFKNKIINKELREFIEKIIKKSDNTLDFDFYNKFIINFFDDIYKAVFFGLVQIYKMKYVQKYSKSVGFDKQKDRSKAIKKIASTGLDILDVIIGSKAKLKSEYNEYEKARNKNIMMLTNLKKDIEEEKFIDLAKYQKTKDPYLYVKIFMYNSEYFNRDYELEVKRLNDLENYIDELEEFLLNEKININKNLITIPHELAIKKLKIFLNYKNIIKYNNIMLILINDIELSDLVRIKEFLDGKIISEELLLNNIDKIKEKNKLSDFINNIILLISNNINISSIIKYDESILFTDYSKLLNLIDLYKKYGIEISNECYNFEWLTKDLSYIIDKFIEIGQYDLIKNNISLLNSNSNMIVKRCILYISINNQLVNEQNKLRGSLRKEENFIISDDELNEIVLTNYDLYIPSDIIEVLKQSYTNYTNLYNLDNIKKYLIDDYTYKFNDILISKNKIIRNLNILYDYSLNDKYNLNDLLLYSIIYDYPKLLTKKDIDYIKDIIYKNIKALKKQTN